MDSVGYRSHTRGRARGGDSRQLRPPRPGGAGVLQVCTWHFIPGSPGQLATCLQCLLLKRCTPTLETFGPLVMRPVQGTGIRGLAVSQETSPLAVQIRVRIVSSCGRWARKISQSPVPSCIKWRVAHVLHLQGLFNDYVQHHILTLSRCPMCPKFILL